MEGETPQEIESGLSEVDKKEGELETPREKLRRERFAKIHGGMSAPDTEPTSAPTTEGDEPKPDSPDQNSATNSPKSSDEGNAPTQPESPAQVEPAGPQGE